MINKIYRICKSILDSDTWLQIQKECPENPDLDSLLNILALQRDNLRLPEFLPDLARLEWTTYNLMTDIAHIKQEVKQITMNPTIQLLQLSWKNLTTFLNDQNENKLSITPEHGNEMILVWKDIETGDIKLKIASDEDLLVLKMIAEEIDHREIEKLGKLPVGGINAVIDRAASRGIILKPQTRIKRNPTIFNRRSNTNKIYLSSPDFNLQWHITQACEYNCKHCYDRSNRRSLEIDKAIEVLDDLKDFCNNQHVRGHVCFSGGNPFLYPYFPKLYRAATDRGFIIGILGNPVTRKKIEELISIQCPSFYQVSLEGLQKHNDMIRGEGHFERTVEFLQVLRDLNVYSMVMLTLTKDNMSQIIPLADMLRELTDSFTFNRLSMVGSGRDLFLPSHDNYASFLDTYVEAAKSNPVMGLKDNLINIILHQRGLESFGGCTGFGCGAAFNFITLLPDGEVHACRKFPSPIGNVLKQRIAEIYDSDRANHYRMGCNDCSSCDIRPVCGGCLAITYSHGLNIFKNRDPYCFIEV